MVGLSHGYNHTLLRKELTDDGHSEHLFSVWYFKNEKLLAVDAVNNAKAYVIGTKLIKCGTSINQSKLADKHIELHSENILP